MRELLEYISQAILTKPEEIEITEKEEEGVLHLTLRVSPEDIGRAIGKDGKVINSIKNLLKVIAVKKNLRVYLEVEAKGNEENFSTEAEKK